MKKKLMLFVLLLVAVVAKAEEQKLQIWLSNGKIMTIKLTENPTTRYTGSNLVIQSSNTTVTFPLEQVKKFTYSANPAAINSPEVLGCEFSADGETLTFTGLQSGTEITVYSMSGQLLRQQTTGSETVTVVSVSSFSTGVYLIKVNGVTYKITKR
jgi:hypothetical protein